MAHKGQARGSAALRTAAVLLCVMLVTMDSFAAAATVNVGGRAGWTFRNYGHMNARRGDTLVFNYNRKAHNVLQVSAADYFKCLVPSRPMKEYRSGKDFVRLNTPGTYYFLCGIPGHCSSGMKVAVTVR